MTADLAAIVAALHELEDDGYTRDEAQAMVTLILLARVADALDTLAARADDALAAGRP